MGAGIFSFREKKSQKFLGFSWNWNFYHQNFKNSGFSTYYRFGFSFLAGEMFTPLIRHFIVMMGMSGGRQQVRRLKFWNYLNMRLPHTMELGIQVPMWCNFRVIFAQFVRVKQSLFWIFSPVIRVQSTLVNQITLVATQCGLNKRSVSSSVIFTSIMRNWKFRPCMETLSFK